MRSVIHICVVCKRHDARQIEFVPCLLTVDLVRDTATFEIIGVDLPESLFLKRGKNAWVFLCTCAIYRAVHLEFTSLSTDSFLQTFRRFFAKRVRPTTTYTDNSTNERGPERYFDDYIYCPKYIDLFGERGLCGVN